MKKKLLLFSFLIFNSFLFAQVNPTLAVGLEKLTMNKGTIDVEVLTKIIMGKQKELKQEALKRFMFKLFPEANFTTKYYIQNCLNVLLNEKNPQVIEKEILELTTNYALSLGVAYAIMKANDQELITVDQNYNTYKVHSSYYQDMVIKEKEKKFEKKDRRDDLNDSIHKYDSIVSSKLTSLEEVKNISSNDFKSLVSNKEELEKFRKKLARLKLRKKISNQTVSSDGTVKVPFGIILDVVSESLSDIPELQRKGFFKNKIDYKTSDFYSNLESNNEGRELKKSLNNMKLYVCKKITPYVKNYDIINEFLRKNKGKEVKDIMNDLEDQSITLITPILNSEKWKTKYTVIRDTLDQIKKLENSIKIINLNIKSNNLDQISIKPLYCNNTNCDSLAISAYNRSIKLNNLLKSFSDKLPNVDINIKNEADEIIKQIPLNLFTSSNIELPKLKEINLENTSNNIIRKAINDTIISINTKISLRNSPGNKGNIKLTAEILNKVFKLKSNINRLPDSTDLIQNTLIDNLIKEKHLQIDSTAFNKKAKDINSYLFDLAKSINNANDTKEKNKDKIQTKIREKYRFIAKSNEFCNEYLSNVLDELAVSTKFNTINLDSLTISKASKTLPAVHAKIKYLINNSDIHMSDIVYLDDYITEKMIELKIRDPNNDILYNDIIDYTKIIIPLLKIRALQNLNDVVKYDEELMNLFEFIANLNNLDKAETYQSIVNMLRDGSKKVQENLAEGEFKDGYVLFINAMKKYTLINPSEEYVEIDVISFLTDLQQYYNRNNKSVFSLYLSLGLDQNFFFTNFKISDGSTINNISFASEKIGVKWRIANFKRFEGYENVVKDDVYLNKNAPFINEFYGIVYGAGLLYSVANTTTNENFDFPHIGGGFGIRFYNALDLNLIIAFPFVKDQKFGNNAFWGFGLDIPLGEYLEKLGSK